MKRKIMGEGIVIPCSFISKLSVTCIMYVIHNGATEPILKALFNTSLMEACPRKNEIQ